MLNSPDTYVTIKSAGVNEFLSPVKLLQITPALHNLNLNGGKNGI